MGNLPGNRCLFVCHIILHSLCYLHNFNYNDFTMARTRTISGLHMVGCVELRLELELELGLAWPAALPAALAVAPVVAAIY